PGIDGAECELAALGSPARARDLVEQPCDLGATEIGVDDQAGAFANQALRAHITQFLAERGSAAVLPDDRVVNRLAGLPVPHDRGLALVGAADRHHVLERDIALSQRFPRTFALRCVFLALVGLRPAR